MFRLMIHGGAGAIQSPEKYRPSLEKIIKEGRQMLKGGASALDTVEKCVQLLEDDPLFNAGRGSVLTHKKEVECDASIMDGLSLKAGAVAGISGVKNPITLARAIMEKSEFVFLIGKGAKEFAKLHNIKFEPQDYFITEERKNQIKEALENNKVVLDHSDLNNKTNEKKLGTVGAIALDKNGNLASATSTGGIVNKQFGRVGDSPVIGAGTYADNNSCAVSCTGYGEQFLRATVARTTSAFVEFQKKDAQSAAKATIKYLQEKVSGLGGLIIIDKNGNMASAYNTPGLLYAKASEKTIEVFV